MNKIHLIEKVATRLGVSRKEAARAVHAVFDVTASTVAGGESVVISNFGTFQPRPRPAHRARNPQTGETVLVPARRRLRFVVSPLLEQAVRDRDTTTSIRKLPKGGKR